ncbi:MAG: undecaprenyl-diphosphate phosphatase [Treponema sp.]|nr:undecaprenyl-diphosphate phosphatase [Treponema sp.]
MTVLQGFLLGLLQGIAEFLPISSSGHLALAQHLFGLTEVPLLFDVILHLATLLAVVIFFWKKIWELLKIFGRWIARRPAPAQTCENLLYSSEKAGRKTIIAIIITTAITGLLGIISSKLIPELPITFTCAGFVVTAFLLLISHFIEKRRLTKLAQNNSNPQDEGGISIGQAITIGIMQGFGTLPGISRSGSTVTGALFSKVDRKIAGDYSFIVSIPAILGAFILELKDLDQLAGSVGLLPLIVGFITAFAVGYGALWLFMSIFKKGKLHWFSLYLIPLGILGIIFLR